MRGGGLRRHQRVADALLEADAPVLARGELPPRLLLGVRRQRPHADRRLRHGVRGARPVPVAIERQRLLDAAAVGEEIRERVGEPEVRGELRAVVRASQHPQLRVRCARRQRAERAERMGRRQRRAGDPRPEVVHLLREVGGGVRVRIERERGQAVRARRAPHAEVDPARRDRLEHAELLGDLEGRVVREHHAGAAYADARRGRRQRRQQDLRRGADDAVAPVVLRNPEPPVAQRVAVPGEGERLADRFVLAAAVRRGRLVEHRQGDLPHRRAPRARAARRAPRPAGTASRRGTARRAAVNGSPAPAGASA